MNYNLVNRSVCPFQWHVFIYAVWFLHVCRSTSSSWTISVSYLAAFFANSGSVVFLLAFWEHIRTILIFLNIIYNYACYLRNLSYFIIHYIFHSLSAFCSPPKDHFHCLQTFSVLSLFAVFSTCRLFYFDSSIKYAHTRLLLFLLIDLSHVMLFKSEIAFRSWILCFDLLRTMSRFLWF